MPPKFGGGILFSKRGFSGLNFFQFPIPDFFTLYPSHQVHKACKDEEERPQETKDGYPFSAIEFLHRAA